MKRNTLFMGVGLCLWLCTGSVSSVFGADLTLQEILNGISVSENLIKSGRVELQLYQYIAPQATEQEINKKIEEEIAQLKEKMKDALSEEISMYTAKIEQIPTIVKFEMGERIVTNEQTFVFDQNRSRQELKSIPENQPVIGGVVDPNYHSVYVFDGEKSMGIDLLRKTVQISKGEFTSAHVKWFGRDYDFPYYRQKGGTRLAGKVTVDGTEQYILELFSPTSSTLVRRIWIDPSKGYITSKIEHHYPDGITIRERLYDKFQLPEGGIWFPMSVSEKIYELHIGVEKVKQESKYLVSRAALNISVSADDFKINIPSGTTVIDATIAPPLSYTAP